MGIILMEIEEEVLHALHEGGTLHLVGCRDGDVAVCTGMTTHKVTVVESSSRSLVVDQCTVVSSSVLSYVTTKIKPNIDARKLPHYPAPPIQALDAQASEHEVRKRLDQSPNVLKSGGFAWVEDALVHKALADLLNSLALQGWPSDHIPREDCLADVAAHGGDRVSCFLIALQTTAGSRPPLPPPLLRWGSWPRQQSHCTVPIQAAL